MYENQVPVTVPPQEVPIRHRARELCASKMIVISMAIGLTACTSIDTDHIPTTPAPAVSQSANLKADHAAEASMAAESKVAAICPVASPTDIRTVTGMFDAPRPAPPASGRYVNNHKQYYAEQQRKLGIVTHDYKSFMAQHDPEWGDPKELFSQHMKFANQFTEQYGVAIQLATPALLKYHDLKGKVPTSHDTRELSYPNAVDSIGYALSGMPVQFVRNDIKLKHIIIDKGESFLGDADPNGYIDRDTIAISGDVDLIPDVFRHEAFHLEDAELCGGPKRTGDDPGFTALNHGVRYIKSGQVTPRFLRTVPGSQAAVKNSINYIRTQYTFQDAAAAGMNQPACTAFHKLNAMLAPAVMLSDYGYTAVTEDQADLGKNTLSFNGYVDGLDRRTPKIRAKFLYLVARMYRQDPNVVKFYALNAARPVDQLTRQGVTC